MEAKRVKELFGINRAPIIPLSLADIPIKAQEMVGQMSISGVQPKLSVKLNHEKSQLVVTPTGGEHILKPQIPHFAHIPENENCCMDIAQDLGISVPPHGVLSLMDGSLAYIVKRFDRTGSQKIHQEDFYQILEKRDKYNGSLEQIGKKIKEISSVPGLDVQLFFERVVFSFLVGNGDGHTKNYSMTYPKDGTRRLSPAYDIVCSKLVIPKETDSALTLNGKNNKLTRKDFDRFADTLQIPEKVRYEMFVGKCDRMCEFIQNCELPEESKEKFISIVQERYSRLKL